MDMSRNDYYTKDIREGFPKVLLLGNGVTRNEGTIWPTVIRKLAEKKSDLGDDVPYSIQASAMLSRITKARQDRYSSYFNNDYEYKEYPILNDILSIPFNAILTTNYTYELENCCCPGFHLLSDEKKIKFIKHSIERADSKYQIHDYYRLYKEGEERNIWHIHGEQRKKSSMILTHDEYGKLVSKIMDANTEFGKETKNDIKKYRSWVHYFIVSDLYILGQGFDFSEFDLWWLLNRRLSESRNGKVYFLAPNEEKERTKSIKRALSAMGVLVETLGITACSDEDYDKFYQEACSWLRTQVVKR